MAKEDDSFPFGAKKAYFSGANLLLVSENVAASSYKVQAQKSIQKLKR